MREIVELFMQLKRSRVIHRAVPRIQHSQRFSRENKALEEEKIVDKNKTSELQECVVELHR